MKYAFNIPRVNVIQSSAGFSVEMLGRTGMEYREGDKVMFIDSEIAMTDIPTIAIWKDSIKAWNVPYEKEPITEEKRLDILKNICAAKKWKGTQVEIHSHATGWVKGWLE